MKRVILFALPLFAAFMLLSGSAGKAPSPESVSAMSESCVCSKDCKACAKDAKNCGKEGCTCMKEGVKCVCSKDCKACAKDMKNCGKEGCTCMKMEMKGMKHGDMKGMDHGNMKGMKKAANSSKLFVRQPTKEELGQEATCPVMTNEKFKVSVATPVVDYKGKAYFMCCKGCPEKFIAAPEKYVK